MLAPPPHLSIRWFFDYLKIEFLASPDAHSKDISLSFKDLNGFVLTKRWYLSLPLYSGWVVSQVFMSP